MEWAMAITSAVKGTSKVIMIASGGAFLSWRGILDLPTSRAVSKVSYNWTFPSLLFVSLTAVVNGDNIKVLAIIVVMSLLNIFILFLLGFILRCLLKVPQDFRNGTIVAMAFGNVGDMVMAIVLGVASSQPFESGAATVGIAYTSLYTVVSSILQFTVGDIMIANEMSKNLEYEKLHQDDHHHDQVPEQGIELASHEEQEQSATDPEIGRDKMIKLHQYSSAHGFVEEPEVSDKSRFRKFFDRICHFQLPNRLKFLKKLVTPPNLAILAGLIIGLVPQLQHILHNPSDPPAAPLGVVFDTLQMVGSATVPLGITNVGAALARIDLKKSKVPWRVSIGICIARLLLMPAIGIGYIYLLTFVWPVLPADDKMLTFVLMIECCVPSAQFLVSLYQIHGGDGQEVAGVMLVQYLTSIFTMAVYVTLILKILS